MHRLLALITAAALTGCATGNKPASLPDGPTLIIGQDKNGRPILTKYDGRTSAGNGQVNDTSEAGIIAALAAKVEGAEWTYASATRSNVLQPDVKTDSEIEERHKAALKDLAEAAAAGAAGSYAKAASEVASLGGQLFAMRAARANAPKPDSGAITTRVLSVGKDHGQTAASLGREFGETLRAQGRASYAAESSVKRVDVTTTNDLQAVSALAETLAKLKTLERQPLPVPAKPPTVTPDAPDVPLPVPVPDATTPAPEIDTTPANGVVEVTP